MEIEEKAKILKGLGTKEIIESIHKYEDELEKAMLEEASFKNLNYGYLAASGHDCQEVKRILAELAAQVPETDSENKKLTAPQKEAWILRQRTENAELTGAINKQKNVAFLMENNQTKTEITKRRLEGTRAVLALRTQQIAFLARD